MNKRKKRPPIHPGSILKMEFEDAGLSANAPLPSAFPRIA
jgi:plasmid maintenance system antidote protein VapI